MVRFHGLDKAPHGCHLPCEPNICKGQELQKLIDSQRWDQVIYMGDSTNDFCPSTRLQRYLYRSEMEPFFSLMVTHSGCAIFFHTPEY